MLEIERGLAKIIYKTKVLFAILIVSQVNEIFFVASLVVIDNYTSL